MVKKILLNFSIKARKVFLAAGVVVLGEMLYAQSLPTPLYQQVNPEVPADFQPVLKGPTPAEAEGMEAERLFCEARVLERSGKPSEALKKYERAWRLSRDRVILQNIVSLAAQEKHTDEMARYFEKLEHPEKMDVLALRMAGLLLISQNNVPQAIRAYEAALEVLPADVYPMIRVVLRYELGPMYYLSGDYDRAIHCMEYVLSALENPKRYGVDDALEGMLAAEDTSLRYQLADMYLLRHEEDRAEAMLARALELERKVVASEKDAKQRREGIQAKEDFFRARIAASRERWDESLQLLESAFARKLRGEGNGPMELLVQVLKASGREKELISRLEKYYGADAENMELGYFLGKQYRQAGDWERAYALLSELTHEVPVMEGYVGLLESAWRLGDSEKFLLGVYQVLAQQDSEEPLMEAVRGLLGEEPTGGEPEETDQNVAEKEVKVDSSDLVSQDSEEMGVAWGVLGTPLEGFWRETLREMSAKYTVENPKNPWSFHWAMSLMARAVKEDGLTDVYGNAALAALERKEFVEGQVPGEAFFVGYAMDLGDRGLFSEAEGVLRQGRKTVHGREKRAMLEYYSGVLFVTNKQYDQAAKAFREAIRLDGDFPLYQRQLGLVYYLEGRTDDAVNQYQKLLEKHCEDYSSSFPRELVKETRMMLSLLESYRENMDTAEEYLESVLDEFPDDLGARNDLAYLWAVRKKNLDRALEYSLEAVAAEPENYTYRDTLGWVYFQMGRVDDALEALEKAASMESDAVVDRHLGEVWRWKGDQGKAVEYYKKSRDGFLQAEKEGKLIDEKERKYVLEQLKSLQ
ncbi:MAG: tetratricopeptide repeat protein [Planctomycetia bacterium]|nr:tetratricopeptide repeat protein [Planctomycetia bacterium]